MKQPTLIAAWLVVLASAGAVNAASQGAMYETRLGPVAFDSSERALVAGDGRVTAVVSGGRARVTGRFTGLAAPATRARLYRGSAPGVPGAFVADLQLTPAASGEISGALDLAPAQAEGLRQGQFYVQIDTAKAPDGALWGWLMPAHPDPGQDVPERENPFAR